VRRFSFICLSLIFIACSANRPNAIPASNRPNPKLTIAVADSLWAGRVDSSTAFAALAAYDELAQQEPGSIILWSRLAHACYYCGQYLVSDLSTRDSLFLQGHEASQSILNQNPEYRKLLFSTGDELMAARGVDASLIDALYWGMASYGQWLVTKSALIRLGQRDLIQTTLEHIHDLDSNYYYGAYYRFKGAFLAQDPQAGTDTVAIRQSFEQALKIAPDYLGNYTLMAQYLCPVIQDKTLFYKLLTTVLTTVDEPGLSYYPENVQEKILAENLMFKAEKEDWFK